MFLRKELLKEFKNDAGLILLFCCLETKLICTKKNLAVYKVRAEEARKFVSKNSLLFSETSTITSRNATDAFKNCFKALQTAGIELFIPRALEIYDVCNREKI